MLYGSKNHPEWQEIAWAKLFEHYPGMLESTYKNIQKMKAEGEPDA
jgi:hypothetical protein